MLAYPAYIGIDRFPDEVRGKYSVNRVFNGLAHNHISHFTLGSDVMHDTVDVLECFGLCLEWFLFGKISFYAL